MTVQIAGFNFVALARQLHVFEIVQQAAFVSYLGKGKAIYVQKHMKKLRDGAMNINGRRHYI